MTKISNFLRAIQNWTDLCITFECSIWNVVKESHARVHWNTWNTARLENCSSGVSVIVSLIARFLNWLFYAKSHVSQTLAVPSTRPCQFTTHLFTCFEYVLSHGLYVSGNRCWTSEWHFPRNGCYPITLFEKTLSYRKSLPTRNHTRQKVFHMESHVRVFTWNHTF